MKPKKRLAHEFVEFIPNVLEDGKIYVSMEYATVVHKCCCGCGKEVVTPLSPTDWKLIFNGKAISLHPSVGNWSFPCRSHYWIRDNTVMWAEQWSQARIDANRAHDRWMKERYFTEAEDAGALPIPAQSETTQPAEKSPWWKKWLPW